MLDLTAWADATPDPAVCVADGSSVAITVNDGCLVIKDGPRGQRVRRYAKVPRILKYLVILDMHGYMSFDAHAWLDDCQVVWAHIDHRRGYPRTLANSGRYTDPVLVRRQAFCGPDGPLAALGVEIIKRTITTKLAGQASNAEYLLGNPVTAKLIRSMIEDVQAADNIDAITGIEGNAASLYFPLWRGMPVRWKAPKPAKPHWLAYPERKTLRRGYETNKDATDPVNALLNFGYKVAETECALSCYGVALSPAMGISHYRDEPKRDSFALDLLETLRPEVDRIVLDMLAQPFDKRLFLEDATGIVSLRAPLTHALISRVHSIAYQALPDLYWIAKRLADKTAG